MEKRYYNYLYNCSIFELEGFLDKDIQEELIRWTNNDETKFSKEKTINLLDSIYGNSLFENKKFRSILIIHLPKEELLKISAQFKINSKNNNLLEIAEKISNKAWGKNDLSIYLSKLWGLDESIFEKENYEFETESEVSPSDKFFELLDYQFLIKQKALHILNSGNGQERLLIQMPTGTGKTKTAMHIVSNFIHFSLKNEGLVIWIANSKELLEQAYETFCNVWKHLGNKSIKCFKIYESSQIDKSLSELNGVAFCGIQKLQSIFSKNEKLKEILCRDCRLIVFDEAHRILANETRTIVNELMKQTSGMANRALIGLTATPGRTTEETEENKRLSVFFEDKLIGIEPELLDTIEMGKNEKLNYSSETNIIRYFQKKKVLSEIKTEKLSYKKEFSQQYIDNLAKENDCGDWSEKELQILAKDRNRNYAIIKKLEELNRDKIPTIVFACSVSHAKLLSAMLTMNEIPNVLVHGELKASERKSAIDNFKDRTSNVNIIINYSVLTTGFDSTNIRCVMITRPTKSIILYCQMIGRGLRGPMMGGNAECLLVDVDDNIKAYDYQKAFSHFDNYWK